MVTAEGKPFVSGRTARNRAPMQGWLLGALGAAFSWLSGMCGTPVSIW